tara:strand:- start:219 stop:506 length:288 start_codon:yes stop_codon:yes gene_type:complete
MEPRKYTDDYMNKFKIGDLVQVGRTGLLGFVIGEGQKYKFKNLKRGPMRPYVKVWTVNSKDYKIWAGEWEWDRTEVISRGIKDDEQRRKNNQNEH